MSARFEELDWSETLMGVISLRRRIEPSLNVEVYEVKLGDEFLMSSLFTVAEVELARLMTAKAAFLHDHATDRVAAGEAANMAKYAAAEAGLHALDAAIQTHGGNGMTSEYGLADMWGMMRLLRIAPVSREMILNFVAQHVLDLPKSY